MIQRTRINVVTTSVKSFSFVDGLGLENCSDPSIEELTNIIERACEQGIIKNNLITEDNIRLIYETGQLDEFFLNYGIELPIKSEMNVIFYRL
jgi:hypothetical protein